MQKSTIIANQELEHSKHGNIYSTIDFPLKEGLKLMRNLR